MTNNDFFNPTPLLKEYLVLDTIDKNKNITQREISQLVNVSVSMVNQYLTEYELKGYILKNYISVKNIEYFLTEKGSERMKVLNISYLSAAQRVYKIAKLETEIFLNQITDLGYKNLVFYGAGEVAEILLQTINDDNSIPINVVGVIDDDITKQGKIIINNSIKSIEELKKIDHDAIMIASYTNYNRMLKNLLKLGYPSDKILYFFREDK